MLLGTLWFAPTGTRGLTRRVNCIVQRHRGGKTCEQQPLSISSVCILARQRPPLDKVSSCQGGYAPPSLGVRVAFRMKHALDFGARSALMLMT